MSFTLPRVYVFLPFRHSAVAVISAASYRYKANKELRLVDQGLFRQKHSNTD